MAPAAGNSVLVNTNILVYASFPGAPFHSAARACLNELDGNGAVLWTSRQVLREFLSVTTRPGIVVPPPSSAALAQSVRQFEGAFRIADEDAGVTALLLDLLRSRTIQGKQVHDANIVATMHRYGIHWLLTHNTSDFARYEPDISVLPLAS